MNGPNTSLNTSSSSPSCAGDKVEPVRSFKTDNCTYVRVAAGQSAILTAVNLGSSVVNVQYVLEDKCDVQLYVPFAPTTCPLQLTASTPMQPIKVPGYYRLCISPVNPDAKLKVDVVDLGDAVCCALDVKCQPAIVVPPTPATPEYCPSLALPDCGGFAYQNGDLRDPAATVVLNDCATPPVPLAYLYPVASPGKTIPVSDCSGVVIGYAQNRSSCAPERCVSTVSSSGTFTEVHKQPATIKIGTQVINGTGPEGQDFVLPAYPTGGGAEVHVTPAKINIGGVPVIGTGAELQTFDLPAYPVAPVIPAHPATSISIGGVPVVATGNGQAFNLPAYPVGGGSAPTCATIKPLFATPIVPNKVLATDVNGNCGIADLVDFDTVDLDINEVTANATIGANSTVVYGPGETVPGEAFPLAAGVYRIHTPPASGGGGGPSNSTVVASPNGSVNVTPSTVGTTTTYNLSVPPCPTNTAPAILLCYDSELIGCGGQKYVIPLPPKHAFSSAVNASPTVLSAAFLDSTKSVGPAPAISVIPLFDNTSTQLRGGGGTGVLDRFFTSIYEIFPFSNTPSAVQAGDVLMLTVAYGDTAGVSGATTFNKTATVSTTGGTATTSAWTRKAQQDFWNLGSGVLDVTHEVWTANVLTSGTVVATVDNPRIFFDNAAIVYVLEALRSTGAITVGTPYLQQVNAAPVVDGGNGPTLVTAPPTTGQYYWSVGMRHTKSTSGAFVSGPTLSTIIPGTDSTNCLATAMTALGAIGGNTATVSATINNPALASASLPSAQSVMAVPITAAGGGGGSSGNPTDTGFRLASSVCNPNGCNIAAIPVASVNPGVVTAVGSAGDIYRLDYKLNGVSYGLLDIRAGQTLMSPALPKKLLSQLASGACISADLNVFVTVLSSTSGQSGNILTISSPELVLEAVHV